MSARRELIRVEAGTALLSRTRGTSRNSAKTREECQKCLNIWFIAVISQNWLELENEHPMMFVSAARETSRMQANKIKINEIAECHEIHEKSRGIFTARAETGHLSAFWHRNWRQKWFSDHMRGSHTFDRPWNVAESIKLNKRTKTRPMIPAESISCENCFFRRKSFRFKYFFSAFAVNGSCETFFDRWRRQAVRWRVSRTTVIWLRTYRVSPSRVALN